MDISNLIKDKLNQLDMILLSTQEELKNNIIKYQCSKNHPSQLTLNSYKNKISPQSLSKLHSFCKICNNDMERTQIALDICQKFNFEMLSCERHPTRKDSYHIKYKCKCGNISETDLRNLTKISRKPNCPKCQNDKNKLDFESIKKEFEQRDCQLLINPNDYQNNKQKLHYQCSCGKKSTIFLSDLRRGRLCNQCKTERSITTNLKVYGVENPSKNELVKEKIKTTMFENHGVYFAQQNPTIMKKSL